MIADPQHELVVLLALVAIYALLGAAVWVGLCGRNNAAVRRLNAAIAARASDETGAPAPDLEATLAALVAENRLPPGLAGRLLRLRPVFHAGRWVAYPSNAYWAYRFKRLRLR